MMLSATAARAEDEPLAPAPDFVSNYSKNFSTPALDVDSEPAWMRRLEHISKNGLPFVRLRRNARSDLMLGIHKDGYLGVFLTPRGDRD